MPTAARLTPSADPSLALVSQGLRKVFGDLVAVDCVDLRVPRGSVYGFLGPNGAGKSTTIKCLTGLMTPTAGCARILEFDIETDMLAIKRRVGVVPEDLALFERLTGRETLAFVGQIHGIGRRDVRKRTNELPALMDLERAAGDLVADYSHGMRKKIALAAALLPAPRLLFLDEPFEGVDAVAAHEIKDLLALFVRGGGTVFLTTHILEIVERLCDHIGIIHRGRLVMQGSMAEIRADGQSLEQRFLTLVGGDRTERDALNWLGR